jgi:AbrB family looped-hinge helix DNA binding protein
MMPKPPKKPQSRLTAQGQISVPARVREGLGLATGSILEWTTEGGVATVRRAGRNTSADIHAAVFKRKPKARTLRELKEGIARHMRSKHARR